MARLRRFANGLCPGIILIMLAGSGCATSMAVHSPRNALGSDGVHHVSEHMPVSRKSVETVDFARALNRQRCLTPMLPSSEQPLIAGQNDDKISVGDILKVDVVDGEEFSSLVEVTADGAIDLPFLMRVPAAGRRVSALEDSLAHRLVKGGFYKRGFAQVSVERMRTGPRTIRVHGAVFSPGVFTVNVRRAAEVSQIEDDATGDSGGPSVAAALRRAAGVRPDADIANIVLIRDGERRVLDLSGALGEGRMENPIVLSGDEIFVPSRKCFQEKLARSSAITAPGVRLFQVELNPASDK